MDTRLTIYLIFTLIVTLFYNTLLHAGISGTLSGKIVDKETGQVLPGAAIVVEGTTMGTMADKNGHFIIYNIPAGLYDVSASMIGYTKLTIKNVKINIDLDTDLQFELSTEVLPLEEVVVTDRRKLIQSEITASTYFISGEEINDRLPIDSYMEAVALLPGVVGSHVRGSRETGVMYLLDGLPIQSGYSREVASTLPNSSIIETMVQTGGFNAEYGGATSGVVNVITKDGRNQVEGGFKFYSDLFETQLAGSDNSRRLELNVGGPLTVGLGGPVINAKYFVSADLNLSDTQHREQLEDTFGSPIFSNYNLNGKLSFDIARNTILTLQGLLSNWKWRRFDPQWRLNPLGLAENKHFSRRLSASLTHTFSPKFFASFRFANYTNKRLVLGDVGEEPPDLTFEDPTDPSSRVTDGSQPWEEETKENINLYKVDLVGQLTSHHLIKTGIEVQSHRIRSNNVRYTAIPINGRNTVQSIAFNRLQNDFEYNPIFFALYFQDKIEFKGITANLGLRYDVFSPKISIEEVPQSFKDLQLRLNSPPAEQASEEHNPISPRLGISLPLSEYERIHFNYGWYYQMPPLYYLYANTNYRLDTYLPIIGNLDLSPIRTVSTELSYKRIVTDDMLFVLTAFTKKFQNLVDTQTFLLNEDTSFETEPPTIGYSQYINSGFGSASGLEVTLQKRFTSALSARVIYTYMKARGTNSTAEEEFNQIVFDTDLQLEEGAEFPLSWDQRHSLVFDASVKTRRLTFNLLYRLQSPLPVTTETSTSPNDQRLSWRNLLDLKVIWKTNRLLNGRLKPFFEVRNLFDENNVIDQPDQTGVRAYRLFDPLRTDHGRRLRIGMRMEF